MDLRRAVFALLVFALPAFADTPPSRRLFVPTGQEIAPAGRLVSFPGRPTDLAALPDGRLAVKTNVSLLVLDPRTGRVDETLPLGTERFAVTGIAVAADGTLYLSGISGRVHVAARDAAGRYAFTSRILLPSIPIGGDPAPTGLALSPDGQTLFVLSGRGNALLRYSLTERAFGRPIDVGVAPYAVLLAGGGKAYVSNWGGERPAPEDPQAASAGTSVAIDPRTGAAAAGSVSAVDLGSGRVTRAIRTGRHPTGLALSPDGRFAYVASAADDVVEVIDTERDQVVESISTRPGDGLPFGSGACALAVSADGSRLFVANATNNALAVVELGPRATSTPRVRDRAASTVAGLVPTAWYPGAVLVREVESKLEGRPPFEEIVVANVKGLGTWDRGEKPGYNSRDPLGAVTFVRAPEGAALAAHTRVAEDAMGLARARAGLLPPRPGIAPRPLPERHGEPSTLRHVVYVIKENRTYDQLLGDLPQGDGDPRLVLFGADVTPNHHALAQEFVLLDRYFCSGVLSADGHAWATEAYVTDYLERHLNYFVRGYPFAGGDPLAYAPTGFLWDHAARAGRKVRVYGEFATTVLSPASARWSDLWDDFQTGRPRVRIQAVPGVGSVAPHLAPGFPGFGGEVPDVYRARLFLDDLATWEREGSMPDLVILLLPNDHTSGTVPGYPTPRASVADNDLALGRIVEGLSRSRFWPATAIFATEDDPQDGVDHVDGHRTVGFALSPYTRRGIVDSGFYTQPGLLKTMELILGLPPMNQLDLAASPLRGAFSEQADPTPYEARPSNVPLDELNPPLSSLSGAALERARASMALDLSGPDRADEATFNRILWHAVRGDETPYPCPPIDVPREDGDEEADEDD